MLSNHRNGYAPYRPPQQPAMQSECLKFAEFTTDRKFYTISLKENIRGKFLVITEHSGRNSSIVVPASGLADFARAFAEMAKADAEFQLAQK